MLCYLGSCCDPRNLKSPAHCERAGSSPTPGTIALMLRIALPLQMRSVTTSIPYHLPDEMTHA